MSNAVAIIEHIRGETVPFGLRSDPTDYTADTHWP